MTFATVEELLTLVAPTTVPTERAQLVIELASSAVVTAAGVPIVERQDDKVTIAGNGARQVLLPSWPVTDVTAVSVDGTVLGDDAYRWSRAGVLERTSGVWPKRLRAIEVTYTHGYTPANDGPPAVESQIPADIKRVTLFAAARALGNPMQRSGEQLGDHNWQQSISVNLTGDEEDIVRRSLR